MTVRAGVRQAGLRIIFCVVLVVYPTLRSLVAKGEGVVPVETASQSAPTTGEAEQPKTSARVRMIDLQQAQRWTIQPAWLGNYTENHSVEATAEGLTFAVRDGMMGAKWSCALEQPVTEMRYVAMRYRGRNLRGWGEYVLYAASGGPQPQESYVIRHGELTDDGQWHVAVAPLELSDVRTLAIQVQARLDDAFLEVAELRFTDEKPHLQLADTFTGTPGWPEQLDGWQPVALPRGNLGDDELARVLEVHQWLAVGPITASGVPLLIRDGRDAAIATPLEEPGEIVVPVNGQACEAYLLLVAEFPQKDEPSYAGSSGLVRHVHRLVACVDYEDGTCEQQFPFAVAARQHAVVRGLQLTALALDPNKELRQLKLVDAMPSGRFALAALTLSDKPGPATEATAVRPTHTPPGPRPVASRMTGIRHDGDLLQIDAETVSVLINLSNGLRVERLENHSGEGLVTDVMPGPLFRMLGDDWAIDSEDFRVTTVVREKVEDAECFRLNLICDTISPGVQVTVWVDVNDPREIGLRASVDLAGRDPAKTRFLFPELCGIGFGGPAEDCWIWCPRRGDVLTAAAVSLREPYAGAGNPLQVVGAFDPGRGTGMYLMTQDLEARSKFYQVQKNAAGARLAVEYTPLHDAQLPRTVIGCCQGDWHQHLERYQQWAEPWCQPVVPRKEWFRQVWSFRQQFMHFALPVKSGIFDEASKTIKLKDIVDVDAGAFGGVDYLHVFDWGWDPVHGRCGDYEPWAYLGGVDNFRSAVDEVQSDGIPVGLYIEGILVDAQSNLGKQHGADWQMLGPAGKPYEYFAPSYHLCPHVNPWQEYLSSTYRRVREQTGARGFYIDQYGFSGPTYWCYNPQHGHPVPITPVLGERAMLRQVREQLGPDVVLYSEESPTDLNSKYQDGSFTYSISSVSDELSASGVNLYRFAFPSFKTIEIICCDQPLGSNIEAVKRCLFNGEAIWIEGIWDRWFTAEVRAQIGWNRRVMRENRHCFAGDHVKPLVPTLLSGLYANQFGQRKDLLGKTCWTIYNTNFRTVTGEVIAVDHAEGAQYLDEITGVPLQPRIADGKAYLTVEIAPRDVIVVSRGLYVH